MTAGPGQTPFDRVWEAHFAYTHGHGIGNPPPPKLLEGVLLLEGEIRAREALVAERIAEKRRAEPEVRVNSDGTLSTRRVVAVG